MDINMIKMNFDNHLFYIKILTNIYVNIEMKLRKVEIYCVRVK
jgi:hypothetical protein